MTPARKAEEEEVAREYAKALAAEQHAEWFWREFNAAIIDRWSLSALLRIKRRAWDIAKGAERD